MVGHREDPGNLDFLEGHFYGRAFLFYFRARKKKKTAIKSPKLFKTFFFTGGFFPQKKKFLIEGFFSVCFFSAKGKKKGRRKAGRLKILLGKKKKKLCVFPKIIFSLFIVHPNFGEKKIFQKGKFIKKRVAGGKKFFLGL